MTAKHADFDALSAFVDGEAPEWADHVAACPRCRKGALCADCLAASQEIRPKPEPTKEAA